jgi:hypothetical protein
VYGSADLSEESTYHMVCRISLELVNGLQLVESRLATWEAELCGFLHKTQLGVEVFELLGVA